MTKKKSKNITKNNFRKEIDLLEAKINKLEELSNRLKYVLEDIRFQRRR